MLKLDIVLWQKAISLLPVKKLGIKTGKNFQSLSVSDTNHQKEKKKEWKRKKVSMT